MQQALHFAGALAQRLDKELDKLCVDEISQLQRRAHSSFSRLEIQKFADALLGSDHLDEQEAYILDPEKYLSQELGRRLQQHRDESVVECTQVQDRYHRGWLKRIGDMVAKLIGALDSETADAENLFVVTEDTHDPTLTQSLKRSAAAQYLMAFLTHSGPLPRSLLVKDGDKEWNVEVEPLKLPAVGEATSDKGLHAILMGLVQEQIGKLEVHNIHVLATALLSKLRNFHQEPLQLQGTAHAMSSFEQQCKQKLVPCTARCPCCGRLCDNPDLGPGHIHSFSHGHQVRGFVGIYLDDGNRTASTKICSQMKDTDIFVDENKVRSTWAEYKKRHPKFDFSDTFSRERFDKESRWYQAWRKVGPRFCQRYKTRFTELGEQGSLDTVPLHFLLVLDESGSMCGSEWEALRSAVGALIQNRGDVSTDRFSAVLFGEGSRQAFAMLDSEAAERAAASLSREGGGTSYPAALEGALLLLKQHAYRFGHHRHVLVFMSDGGNNMGDWRPTADQLQREFGVTFARSHCIGFGDAQFFKELREVCDRLGGKFVNSVTDMDLVKAFAEIAQPKTM